MVARPKFGINTSWTPSSYSYTELLRPLPGLSHVEYSRTPLIRINWDGEPSGYAEIPDNWIFIWKYATIGTLKWEKFLPTAVLGFIFISVQIKQYIIPYMYLTIGGKI
jgi:hypothetical protein